MAPSLDALWKRGTEFLGTRYAILGGAMSWVSERNLVSAISENGAFGVIACSAMSPDLLREEIQETKKLTSKPFGVNLIIMHPELDALVEVCKEEQVSHVVLAGGMPRSDTIQKVKAYGGKVLCFTPTLALGKKLIRSGADALIIEGLEAGGHIGPVSTSVLAQEILPELADQVPIFVAGGIGRGEAIGSYLEMGASGCQLGTRFVCATESIAHENFKKVFIRSNARDAISSVQIDPDLPVIPVRAIHNKASKDFLEVQKEASSLYHSGELDKQAAQLKIEHFWAGALRKAVIEGDIESGSLMAGQSVGMVTKEQPTQEIIQELVEQAETYLHSNHKSCAPHAS